MRVQRCGFFFIYCGSPPRVVKVAIAADDCFFFFRLLFSHAHAAFFISTFDSTELTNNQKSKLESVFYAFSRRSLLMLIQKKNEHDTIEFGIVTECKDEAFDFYASN